MPGSLPFSALSDVEMPNLKGWCREIEQEHSAETAARRIGAAKEAEHLVALPKVA